MRLNPAVFAPARNEQSELSRNTTQSMIKSTTSFTIPPISNMVSAGLPTMQHRRSATGRLPGRRGLRWLKSLMVSSLPGLPRRSLTIFQSTSEAFRRPAAVLNIPAWTLIILWNWRTGSARRISGCGRTGFGNCGTRPMRGIRTAVGARRPPRFERAKRRQKYGG